MEYVIMKSETQYFSGGMFTSLQFAARYKNKARAEATAARHGGKVVPFYGVPAPQGVKAHMPGKTPPVNGNKPYRSI